MSCISCLLRHASAACYHKTKHYYLHKCEPKMVHTCLLNSRQLLTLGLRSYEAFKIYKKSEVLSKITV